MNEELLQAIYDQKGFSATGRSFDQFKSDMLASEDMRRAVWEKKGFSQFGDFDKFQRDLGIHSNVPGGKVLPNKVDETTSTGPQPANIVANPGMDDERLKKFYSTDYTPGQAHMSAGPGAPGQLPNPVARTKSEEKAASLLNSDPDPVKAAMSIHVDLDNKIKRLGGDPEINRAQLEVDALNIYAENADLVSTRSKDRLKQIYSSQFSNPDEMDRIVESYLYARLSGNHSGADKMRDEHPELLSDVNTNNILHSRRKLYEASDALKKVETKYPKYKAREDAKDAAQKAADEKESEGIGLDDLAVGSVNPVLSLIRKTPGFKQAIGRFMQMIPTPETRSIGRDIVEFNPKGSDWQGPAIPNYKSVTVGNKNYNLIYSDKAGKNLMFIRDKDSGKRVEPTEEARKKILSAAESVEMKTGFNPKTLASQVEDVTYDLLPVIAITAATGGAGTALGVNASLSRGMGVVAGSAMQVRGQIMDEMLRHPDLTTAEAALYSWSIASGIGALSLINPIESKLVAGMSGSVARKQLGRLVNKEITKPQLRWEITKDIFKTMAKEPAEEIPQEYFEHFGKRGIDLLKQEGLGEFNNQSPSLNDLGEITLVSAIVGLLGGAGSIRTSRNQYIDAAMDLALKKPQVVDKYLSDVEAGIASIADPTERQAAVDHVTRLKDRWNGIKKNVNAFNKLDSRKRVHLASLIADSNALEEELSDITNKSLRSVKEEEIKQVNDQIDALITGRPAPKDQQQPAPPPTTTQQQPDATVDKEDEEDIVRDMTTAIGTLTPGGASVSIEYFAKGQTVEAPIEGAQVEGEIVDLHKRTDGGTHSIEIRDKAGKNHVVTVFGKTPKELGITIKQTNEPITGSETTGDATPGKQDTPQKPIVTEPVGGRNVESPSTDQQLPEGTVTPGRDVKGKRNSGQKETEPKVPIEQTVPAPPVTPKVVKPGSVKQAPISNEIEDQEQKTFPRKDFEKNENFRGIKQKYQKSPNKRYGRRITRTLPSGEKITGTYVLVNKNDIAASHLPFSFAKTPGVPVTPEGNTFNDNDYEKSKNAQAVQTAIASKYDARAIDDLVFVDKNGIVKSGNGRTISRQMSTPESAKDYLAALKERADEFGFTPEQVESIGDDVMIAVELHGDPVYSTQEYAKFNAPAEKQKTPLERAIAISKTIDERVISQIAQLMDEADVMSDLSPKNIRELKNILIRSDIISELNQTLYFDENNKITAAGHEFLQNMLLASVFIENELRILSKFPSVRKNLAESRVRLIKNSQKDETLNIIPRIREAIYLIDDASKYDGSYENRLYQHITQGNMFNEVDVDPTAITFALIINKSEQLRETLDRINNTESGPSLFGDVVTYDDIVGHILASFEGKLNEEGKRLLQTSRSIAEQQGARFQTPADSNRDISDGPRVTEDPGETVERSEPAAKSETQQEEEPVVTEPEPTERPISTIEEQPVQEKRKVRDQKLKSDIDDAWKDLLKGGPLTVGGLDPEKIEAGMKLIGLYMKAGVYKFRDIVEDAYGKFGPKLADYFDALKAIYATYYTTQATDEEAEQMDANIRNLTYDSLVAEISPAEDTAQATQEEAAETEETSAEEKSGAEGQKTPKFEVEPEIESDVPNRPGNRQQNRPGEQNLEQENPALVRGEDRGGSRLNRNEDEESIRDERIPADDSQGALDLFTPIIRTPSADELRQEDENAQPTGDDAGAFDGRGNRIDSSGRSESVGATSQTVNKGTTSRAANFWERQKAAAVQQKSVENIPAILMDEDNIRETLPYLLVDQQGDVIKAERRFFHQNHNTPAWANGKAIMFTNGTGTGKTYTGLGIVKRFQKQGKDNILIVTPTQPKVSDWIEDAKNLQLRVTALENTSTAGQGIVITTFANFRSNEKLLERDFDLIIYDESHRIMEAKGGKQSGTTTTHYMMGNKDASWALRRLQETHPLWKKEREIASKYKGANQEETKKLDKQLEIIRAEQEKVLPGMRYRADRAADNTKVVFLSATPFKEHFNLRYANGFLFDWGSEDITNSQGSRVDAESRFFLENFGSAYDWKYHRLQQRSDANPDAIAMQEIAFAEKLMSQGVMSGRAIESDRDYSREFPKVAGFNSEEFNKAFNDIFNYETNQFSGLREASRLVFFNYNYTTQLFESLKTSMSLPRIDKHLKLGRKVVVFHRRKMAEATPPFESIYAKTLAMAKEVMENQYSDANAKEKAIESVRQAEEFKERYDHLFQYEKTLDYRTALEQIEAAYPGRVGYINGDISVKNKNEAIRSFNMDRSDTDILVVQEEAGKEGISLHDTTGKHQRVLISLSMPISTTTALQVEGRIYRIGQESDAIFEYPLLGLDIETAYFGRNLNKRLGTTENLAMGNASRDLIRSYAEGVLFNSSTDDPHLEQGKGGKEYDHRQASTQSEFQKAILVYFSNQKKRGRRDQREGVDYFATPEPLGQKMVEWLGLRPGDHAMEPSAGHGAIAMWFPTSSVATSIEPSFDLYSKLSARAGGGTRKILNQKFEDYNIVNKYDGIAMNPPFGHAGSMAMQHVEKAFKHLRDGGRLVALLPDSPTMNRKLEDFLYGSEGTTVKLKNPDAHLRKVITLPSVTFQQAGTSVNTKIVIIDKLAKPDYQDLLNEGSLDLRGNDSIKDLFEAIEFIEAPERLITEERRQHQSNIGAESDQYGSQPPAAKAKKPTIGPVTEHKHTKTNAVQYSAKASRFLDTEYKAVNGIANNHMGYYSRFTKSWLFDTKEAAESFRAEVNNKFDTDRDEPRFSISVDQQAEEVFSQEAANDANVSNYAGAKDPNAQIVINLHDANAKPNDLVRQYAGIWLDQISNANRAFYNKGLILIQNTEYYSRFGNDPRAALEAAIADRTEKIKKTPDLINWVKGFWTRIGKMLKLNITPDQLYNLTVAQYIDIAATHLRFSNDIFLGLVADGAVTPAQGFGSTDTQPKPKSKDERQNSIGRKYDEYIASNKKEVTASEGPSLPVVSAENRYEFEGRNLDAKTDPMIDPTGKESTDLLKRYSGKKRNLIESALLVYPSLKNAGISLTFHESVDSYYNAVVDNKGTLREAVHSGGFYNNKQVHINIAKPDLNTTTALHEAMHPVIRSLFISNKEQASKFVNEILADEEMKYKYFNDFAWKYYSHLTPDEQSEEAIVEATADIILQRILSNMNDLSDNLFDRIIKYIKDALGETYGKLFDLVNTKSSFKDFANSLADGISKGMAIPIDAQAISELKTIVNQSIQFSFSIGEDRSVSQRNHLKAMLEHDILTNPDIDFEPIAAKLVSAGRLNQAEVDDVLHAWRTARKLKFTTDNTLNAIVNMAELRHLRRMDEQANRQIKNENLKNIIDAIDGNPELIKQYSPYRVKELIEKVSESGDAHPVSILETLNRLNDEERPGNAKDAISIAIAIHELEQARRRYKRLHDKSGSSDAMEQVHYIDDMMYRLASAAKTNGSYSGQSLGIRSKLLELAGLTYQSQLIQLEAINSHKQTGKNMPIDDATKDELRKLVDQNNALQEALDKAMAEVASKESKAKAAEAQYVKMTKGSGLESRPQITKDHALALLRRLKHSRPSFSIALSAVVPEEMGYYDIINELVKIAHEEGAKGFKEVVDQVREYDDTITEEDIYRAILSTTKESRANALSEYARRQALTRKHVKAIDKLEKMLTKAAISFLRDQSAPEESQISDVGKLLKEIENNIYSVDATGELMTHWTEALENIKETYAIAFLNPVPTEDTEIQLGKMLNAIRMIKDQKFHDWLEKTNKELDDQIALINEGRVSELIEQEDASFHDLPTEMEIPIFDENGVLVGSRKVPYNYGVMDRMIKDKRREIEAVKNRFRNRNAFLHRYNKLRGTVGSSLAIADLSYFAIQGFRMMTTVGHKKYFWSAFVNSIKAMRDEFRENPSLANNIHAQILDNQYYDRLVDLGLVIIAPDAHVFVDERVSPDDFFDDIYEATKGSTSAAGRLTNKTFGLRRKIKLASNAAFATHLNLLSITTASNYIEKIRRATGEMPSDQELATVIRDINNSTGRSNLIPKVTKGLSYVFWAPKLYLSQVLNLGNIILDPIMWLRHSLIGDVTIKGNVYHADKTLARAYKYRAINGMLFASIGAGLYTLRALLAKWQCGDNYSIATIPERTNFLKINCGEFSFDPTGNHRQWIGLGFNLLSTVQGKPPQDFFGNDMTILEQIFQRFQYKLAPHNSFIIQILGGTDFLGRKRVPGDTSPGRIKSRAMILLDNLQPIFIQNLQDVIKGREGVKGEPFIAVEALLGSGVTYINAEENIRRKAIEREESAERRIEKHEKAKGRYMKTFGKAPELEGEFMTNFDFDKIKPTNFTFVDDSGTYQVYKRLNDTNHDGIENDYFVVKEVQNGANAGKKKLERVSPEEVGIPLN